VGTDSIGLENSAVMINERPFQSEAMPIIYWTVPVSGADFDPKILEQTGTLVELPSGARAWCPVVFYEGIEGRHYRYKGVLDFPSLGKWTNVGKGDLFFSRDVASEQRSGNSAETASEKKRTRVYILDQRNVPDDSPPLCVAESVEAGLRHVNNQIQALNEEWKRRLGSEAAARPPLTERDVVATEYDLISEETHDCEERNNGKD